MSDEILVNVGPTETRVALIENGVVQEIYIERVKHKGFVGNIYKGKVVRVLPGMQAAFIDIGQEKAGFIHADDIAPLNASGMEERIGPTPDISELVREGQTLVVQVAKDPIGTKGARLTTHLSVSARYLVYMPQTSHLGVSNRIEDEAERERLKLAVENLIAPYKDQYSGGFIVRTLAEGVSEEELAADIPFVYKLWHNLADTVKKAKAPSIIYEDLPLFLRTLRDLMRPQIEKVRIDSRESFVRLEKFAKHYAPEIGHSIEHYPDVNTGAFVGHRNLEETIFKTNLEAAAAIARQLRLRNLGGIIVIDFIDMTEEEHRRQVLRTLEKSLERDRAKSSIHGVSHLGLVQMTRKRTRESLSQVLCEPCPACQGRGLLKSAETVCYEMFREILREARMYDNKKFLVLASQLVVDRLLEEESANVADLEAFIGRPVEFQVETLYNQEQYDIVLV
jgi:ribonuclease G